MSGAARPNDAGEAFPNPHVGDLDWAVLEAGLDADGYAVLPGFLAPAECRKLTALYAEPGRFRKHIVMENHGYGRGEYRYFAYELPSPVAQLRTALYPPLAKIANRWNEALGIAARFPAEHAAFIARCHREGQTRPTPLLLHYGAGDYNRLHQDLYGAHVFPLQATFLLSPPEAFSGGEFLLVESRSRLQSRGAVVPLGEGDGVIFPVRERPVRSARGFSRATMRHGVSRIAAGERMTLGIIFHDAA